MHMETFRAQCHHLVANLHNVGEADLIQPLCQPDPALPPHLGSVSFLNRVGEVFLTSISDSRFGAFNSPA